MTSDPAAARPTSLAHRAGLAKLLERGKFDAMFLADVLGAYGGSPDAALRGGVQVPVTIR